MLDKWLNILNKQSVIAVDTETSSLNPLEADLVGLSFCYEPNKACYIPLKHTKEKCLDEKIVLKKIKELLEDPSIKKTGQNIKFDYIILKRKNINCHILTVNDNLKILAISTLHRVQIWEF